MSAGLFGLLDDVAAIARMAAASVDDIGAAAGRATAKAAGVVIDDTAVTPQYVHGIAAERELPIIKRIADRIPAQQAAVHPARGIAAQSVRAVAADPDPDARRDLSLLRGRREGVGPHSAGTTPTQRRSPTKGEDAEKHMVTGAIRTDFILSAEIMVIALNEVADQAFLPRLIILVIVAVVITAAVYGVVAGIVKMDDVGLSLTQRSSAFAQRIGRGLVAGMPKLLAALSTDRHGGDAVGRRPHPAGRDRRPRLARARTASFTTGRKPSTTSEASAACWPGWSTPRLRRSSAWSSEPWWSRSCIWCSVSKDARGNRH